MWVSSLDPVLLKIGFLEVRWYSLMYILSFVILYYYLKEASKKKKIDLKEEQIDSLLFYILIGLILGARIFEVLFYNREYYFLNPSEIFKTWHGGLSFHGGLVGIIIAVYIFSKKNKITFLKLSDLIIVPASIGLFFGRIGNFINGELYGTITSVPWAVKFPLSDDLRHPSQIYEAIKNLVIFSTLYYFKDKKCKDGTLLSIFLIMYGVIRFFIEFVREPETMFYFLTMGQALCIITTIAGLILWLKINKK